MKINIFNQEEKSKLVQQSIDEDRLNEFYVSAAWLNLRDEVLAEHKCYYYSKIVPEVVKYFM